MEDTNLLLGLDIGTTNIKCIAYDTQGNQVGYEGADNIVEIEHTGYAEQDMNLLWDNVVRLIKRLLSNNEIEAEKIQAIGLTGQGEGLWLIDKQGNPVSNAVLWSDSRAKDVVKQITSDPELLTKYKNVTGSYPFPGAQIIILKWMAENRPDKLKKADHLLFCKDWVRYKMTGEVAIDYTDASTSVINLQTGQLAEGLLSSLSLEEQAALFPPLKGSTEIAGWVTEELSRQTGLKKGTLVITGMMDIAATALGVGAVAENDCCTILGTTSCNEIVTDGYQSNEESVAGYEIHAASNKYLHVMATMAGTPNLDWFLAEFFEEFLAKAEKKGLDPYQEVERRLKQIEAGSGGIIYHPYISLSGERAPFADSNARAQFFGLSNKSSRFHLLRAVYEGVAYSIRDSLDNSPEVNQIFLTGGGAKSRLWAKIIADVTGKTVYIVNDDNPASKGAALMAGLAAGIYQDINDVVAKTSADQREKVLADKKNKELYDELYELYFMIRKTNTKLWKKRADIIGMKGGI